MRHVKKIVKSHAGQARSASRKRLRQLQKLIAAGNQAQKRQDVVKAQIIVQGMASWTEAFPEKISIHPAYARYFGGVTVKTLDYFRVESDMNRVSFERTILGELLTKGYELQELEVQFDDEVCCTWGTCTWLKEHPSYHTPSEDMNEMFPLATAMDFSIISAKFNTEHAGEQEFGLLSMQMFSAALLGQRHHVLLHKTLIFRRAVLTPPIQALAKAA